jgi:hypothetical protein
MKLINSIFSILRFNQKNWKAVVLCIFAATIFWFFNALNKTYTTNLRFPLTFDYDHQNFVPVKSLPHTIRINVTGNGWDLFRRSAGLKIPPLEIPLERPMETKKIIGSTLPAFFTSQIEGLEINYVLTDTIYVDLEPKTGRWIRLAIDSAQLPIKTGYGLASHISILPDSVRVEGPKTIINDLSEPIVLKLPFNNIDDQFMEDVEVNLSSEFIKRDPPVVAVMFNVQKMLTVTDSIKLVIRNLPSNVWPVIGRKRIPVTLQIPENMTDQLWADSISAVIDLKKIKKGERKVSPAVEGLPPFTTVIKIDSVRVKF